MTSFSLFDWNKLPRSAKSQLIQSFFTLGGGVSIAVCDSGSCRNLSRHFTQPAFYLFRLLVSSSFGKWPGKGMVSIKDEIFFWASHFCWSSKSSFCCFFPPLLLLLNEVTPLIKFWLWTIIPGDTNILNPCTVMRFVLLGNRMIHFLTHKVMGVIPCETIPEQLEASGNDNSGVLFR